MATLQILADQLREMLHVAHIGITQNQTGSNWSSKESEDWCNNHFFHHEFGWSESVHPSEGIICGLPDILANY